MKRLAVLLLSLIGFFLLSEGVLSFFGGRSWRDLAGRGERLEQLTEPLLQTDAERFRAAAQTPGPFRRTEDPLVGYTLKADTEVSYDEGRAHERVRTDELGLRARPGAPPAEDAFRIVLLGDSVAFGQGLEDHEVLAVELERVLREARMQSHGARDIVCRTVAIPSWNYRNAFRFLFDHLDRLAPDVVLYVAVENDLEDSYGANEAGQRCAIEDPGVPHPLLHVQPEWGFLKLVAKERTDAGLQVDQDQAGPEVLCAGLTPSSRWRLADLARTLAHAEERLERRGARLALAPHEGTNFLRQLCAELAEQGLEVPVIPLLERMQKEDTLGWDPHPSAATVRAFALWIAAALSERGWLPEPGGRVSFPEVEARYADRRGRELGKEEALAWRRTFQEEVERDLEPVIEPETLRGMLQVYGGINLDRTVPAAFAAVLPRGRALRVRLAPIEDRPDLYPLDVDVYVNERRIGSVTVAGDAPSEGTFPLAESEARGAYEVRLEPLDWAVVTRRGKSWIASARLLELASVEE